MMLVSLRVCGMLRNLRPGAARLDKKRVAGLVMISPECRSAFHKTGLRDAVYDVSDVTYTVFACCSHVSLCAPFLVLCTGCVFVIVHACVAAASCCGCVRAHISCGALVEQSELCSSGLRRCHVGMG